MYLFCTNFVPFGFRYKIGILILYLGEILGFFSVPARAYIGADLVSFSRAFFVPVETLIIFSVLFVYLYRT